MAFPSNPVDLQTTLINGVVYVYDSSAFTWSPQSSSNTLTIGSLATFSVSGNASVLGTFGIGTASPTQTLTVAGSIGATIFYDLDNTGYYTNPNSTSNMYTAVFNNTAYSYNWWRSYNATGWYNETYGGGVWMTDSTYVRVYNGKNFLVESAAHMRIGTGEANEKSLHFHNDARYLYFFQQSVAAGSNFGLWDATGSFTRWLSDTSGNFYNYVSIRAPIFYDTDNTGYYFDGNNTSRLYGINLNILTGSQQNYSVANSSNTVLATPSGVNSTSAFIHFTGGTSIAPYSMYRSYGDWSAPYGIGWTNGGESSGIFQRFASNSSSFGDLIYYIGNDGVGAHSFRAAGWESTTYYSAGSNQYNTELLRIQVDGSVIAGTRFYTPIMYDNNDTAYYCDPNGTARLNVIYCGDVYNDKGGWFRSYGSVGIYNQSYGNHFYAEDARYYTLAGTGGQWGGLRFRDGYGGTIRGYVYWDGGENFGLLHKNGGWNYRGWTDGFEAYGYWHYQTRIQAYMYYDRDDTAYYCDPNGYSLLSRIRTPNWIESWDGTPRLCLVSGDHNYYRSMNWHVFRNVYDQDTHYFHWNGDTWTKLWGDWYTGNFRSAIFYDYNDTAYYCDPNGYSRINYGTWNGIGVGCGAYDREGIFNVYNGANCAGTFDGGWGQYGSVLQLRTEGGGTQDGPRLWYHKVGQKWWSAGIEPYGSSGYGIWEDGGVTQWGSQRFRIDPGGSVVSNVRHYSPIYYDLNDGGYYCDPNSTSVLLNLYHNGNTAYFRGGVGVDQCCGDWGTISLGGSSAHNPSIAWHYSAVMEGTMVGSGDGWRKIYFYDQQGAGLGIHCTGILATNNYLLEYYSDQRLKENFVRMTDHWDILNGIKGYRFTWNELSGEISGFNDKVGTREVGLIAQDVLAVYPEAVVDRTEGPEDDKYKTILYNKFAPVFVEALNDLKAQLDQLKLENQQLREMINDRK